MYNLEPIVTFPEQRGLELTRVPLWFLYKLQTR